MAETVSQYRRRIEQIVAEHGPDTSEVVCGPDADGYTLRILPTWRDVYIYGAIILNCWQGIHVDEKARDQTGDAAIVRNDRSIQYDYLILCDPDGLPIGAAMHYDMPGIDPIDGFEIAEGTVCLASPEGLRVKAMPIDQIERLVAFTGQRFADREVTISGSCKGIAMDDPMPWRDALVEIARQRESAAA
jgi:hypothetical protein